MIAADIRPLHVQQWVDSYTELSQTSRRNYVRSVKRCVKWATQQGYLLIDPVASMEVPGAESKDVYVSPAEFEELCSYIKKAIYEHSEFTAFIDGMNDHFTQWRKKVAEPLKGLSTNLHPNDVIVPLSDGLLKHYQAKPLIDPYTVYQHLMSYWSETMKDDCYIISEDGWKAEPARIIETDKRGKEKDKGWACDLVPKSLIVARYFRTDQDAIDLLAAEQESVTAKLAEIEEQYGGDEGPMSELEKVNKANVAARL